MNRSRDELLLAALYITTVAASLSTVAASRRGALDYRYLDGPCQYTHTFAVVTDPEDHKFFKTQYSVDIFDGNTADFNMRVWTPQRQINAQYRNGYFKFGSIIGRDPCSWQLPRPNNAAFKDGVCTAQSIAETTYLLQRLIDRVEQLPIRYKSDPKEVN